MRPSGSYEMKPRQLRALVMLLVLLPLIPTAFVVRFLVEAIYSEHLESRERIKPVYAQLLDASSSTLAVTVSRLLPNSKTLSRANSGHFPPVNNEMADAVVRVAADGRISRFEQPILAGADNPAAAAAAERLEKALVDAGVRYAHAPYSGAVRWRFFSETPEPLFALRPAGEIDSEGSSLLLIKTRHHLLGMISAFYSRALDSQSVLRVIDENGDEFSLVGPAELSSGEPLAELMLPAPLPAWRLRIFSVDTTFIDGIAREQITLSIWAVGGMVVVTLTIAGLAGLFLRRRIALQEMRNDILAIVSHEMRTPLSSMRMFIDTLLERRYRGGAEQADEYLQLIAQENSRLERLAESFLTLSRLDGQRGRGGGLNLKPADLDALARAAVERLRPRLDPTECDFTLELAGKPVPFVADEEAVLTALVNLLENALKYTGDDKQIRLSCFVDGEHVGFEVADNGQGIAPDEQGRIFERFYQSDRRLARTHAGCGLGLSLVRSIVRAHGGTVSVRSELGKGSVFTVCLPATESSGAVSSDSLAVPSPAMR